jgi:hypothetical protein
LTEHDTGGKKGGRHRQNLKLALKQFLYGRAKHGQFPDFGWDRPQAIADARYLTRWRVVPATAR